MGHHTYDDLIALVAEFRLEHRNLTDEDLDKLINQTFKIDRATLRERSFCDGQCLSKPIDWSICR